MEVKYNLQKLKRQLEVIQAKHSEDYREVQKEVEELNVLVKEENKVVQEKLDKVFEEYTSSQIKDLMVEGVTKSYTTENFFGWKTEHTYTTEVRKEIVKLPEPLVRERMESTWWWFDNLKCERISGGYVNYTSIHLGDFTTVIYTTRSGELRTNIIPVYVYYPMKQEYYTLKLKYCPEVKKLQDKILHLESIGITEVVLGDTELSLLLD